MSLLKPASWNLSRNSFKVAAKNKAIIIYPICTGALNLAMLFGVVLPMLQRPDAFFNAAGTPRLLPAVLITLLIYFLVYHFLFNLSNAAIMTYLNQFHAGEKPSISAGFKVMLQKFWRLYLWTNVMTTIGNLIRLCEGWSEGWYRLKLIHQYLRGLHWRTAIYLTSPLLVFENLTIRSAIKESTHLIQKTWGHSVKYNLSHGLVIFGLRIIALLPLLITVYVSGRTHIWMALSITASLFICVSLLSSVTQTTLMHAIYRFAKQLPVRDYPQEALQLAFVPF